MFSGAAIQLRSRLSCMHDAEGESGRRMAARAIVVAVGLSAAECVGQTHAQTGPKASKAPFGQPGIRQTFAGIGEE